MLALAALQQGAAAGVMCLRGVNPYVAAALGDWRRRGGAAPAVPRASAAAPQVPSDGALAGKRPMQHLTHTAGGCLNGAGLDLAP